jgi:hypothetical protein
MKELCGRETRIDIGPQTFIPTAALESHETGQRISLSILTKRVTKLKNITTKSDNHDKN